MTKLTEAQKISRYCELFYWFRWCFPWRPLSEQKFKTALEREGIPDYAMTNAQVYHRYFGDYVECRTL